MVGEVSVAAAVTGTVALGGESPMDTELGELDLLSDALSAALAAQEAGLVIGGMDEVALGRAERRARRADGRTVANTLVVAA